MATCWDPQAPSLSPSIVCYADILGFRHLIGRAFEAGKEEHFLQKIKHSLDKAYERVREAQTLSGAVPSIFDMKVFTDNIVVACPLYNSSRDLSEPEFGILLTLFAEVQSILASDGLPLRGGIAWGDHYQDDDVAYGKAFLEAIDLDKPGTPHRLVIARSLEPLIAKQLSSYGDDGWTPYHRLLLEDPCDGRLFVNYLWVAFANFPDGPIDNQLLAAHCEIVHGNLVELEPGSRVRAHYEWMATYHNYVCGAFARRYSFLGGEEVDSERIAIAADAQRALEYLVPFESPPSAQVPRLLNASRLRQRLRGELAPGECSTG